MKLLTYVKTVFLAGLLSASMICLAQFPPLSTTLATKNSPVQRFDNKVPTGQQQPTVPLFPQSSADCSHDLTFCIFDTTPQVFSIRVSGVGSTKLTSATAPTGWNSTYAPNAVEFKQTNGGRITSRESAGFSITVTPDQIGKQTALVEFKDNSNRIICSQMLNVPCLAKGLTNGNGSPSGAVRRVGNNLPDQADNFRLDQVVPSEARPYGSNQCYCIFAVTDADETSLMLYEPDIDVEVLGVSTIAFRRLAVKYKYDVEPAFLPTKRVWTVTHHNPVTGVETDLNLVPVSDTVQPTTKIGTAVFNVPLDGEYSFMVEATSTCLPPDDERNENAEDFDDTDYYKVQSGSTIAVKPDDPCDVRVFEFRDETYDDPYDNIQPDPATFKWYVGPSASSLTLVGTGSPFKYTFPTSAAIGSTWVVAFDASDNVTTQLAQLDVNGNPVLDSNGNPVTTTVTTTVARPRVTKPVTIIIPQQSIDFSVSYNSCGTGPYTVTFENKSSGLACPGTWTWNFGDPGSGSQNTLLQQSPLDATHVYAGNFTTKTTKTVTLTFKDQYGQLHSASKPVILYQWSPTIVMPKEGGCQDGTVILATGNAADQVSRLWTIGPAHLKEGLPINDRIKLCYDFAGGYTVQLWARNKDGGECNATQQVNVPKITHRCYVKDRTNKWWKKGSLHQFTYNGKTYGIRYRAKYNGKRRVIYAKTKLQRWNGNKWVRKRANTVGVSWAGDVKVNQVKAGLFNWSDPYSCPCDQPGIQVSHGKSRNKRAKVAKRVKGPINTGGSNRRFIVETKALTFTFTVKVDSNHTWETTTTQLPDKLGCEK